MNLSALALLAGLAASDAAVAPADSLPAPRPARPVAAAPT